MFDSTNTGLVISKRSYKLKLNNLLSSEMVNPLIFCLIIPMNVQSEVPYKPSGEFELKINYIFRERPPIDRQTVEYDKATDEKVRKATSGPLPYLMIQLKVLSVTDQELRVRVTDAEGHLAFNRKAEVGTLVKLDWGFAEDIKDRIVPHEYSVVFIDSDKKPVSRIFMTIQEDGTFFVNEEKRGKF